MSIRCALTKPPVQLLSDAILIVFCSHDPLYLDGFKSALYRTATADALHKIISRMQEPWPRGYEGLARLVESSNSGGQGWDGERPEGPFEGCTTVSQLWEAQAKQTKFAKRMLTAWGETRPRTGTGREMDALLMPTSPWPLSKRRVGNGSSGGMDGILMQWSYRFQFSYDNYTSSYMKCTRLLRDDDSGHARLSLTADAKPEREAPSDLEARIWQDCKSMPSAWHSVFLMRTNWPESMMGCPVSVKLVVQRLHEAYLMQVTKKCDEGIRVYTALACECLKKKTR